MTSEGLKIHPSHSALIVTTATEVTLERTKSMHLN